MTVPATPAAFDTAPRVMQARDAALVRIAQVTDTHILAEPGALMKDMNTRASFEAVCADLFAEHADLDLLLATGDLSQDGSVSSYEYLARQFDALPCPVFCLPGNHDDTDLMRTQLESGSVSTAKQIEIGAWTILLLDSTIPGEVHGRITSAELDFMQAVLDEVTDRHVLVCLHHQARPAGSDWIDRLGLEDDYRLRDCLQQYAQVRGVLWGHVHQQADWQLDNISWMSSPSTCVQFRPGSEGFALDDVAPGYRVLDLHADGRIETSVRRLARRDFGAS